MSQPELLVALAAFFGGVINSVAGGGTFLTFPALLLAGVAPIPANATSNTGMFLGVLASARGYREEVRAYRRRIAPALVVSIAGAVGGALLLLLTPPRVFEWMIPWLLLFATLVFAVSPLVTRRRDARGIHSPVQLALQFCVSVYGGYFGAGMGILMLAILSFSGLPNMNAMNGVKSVLSFAITGVAVVPFAIAGIVLWPVALLMGVFAILGGYAGARFFRLVPSRVTRAVVLFIGAGMTAYFFFR